MDQVHYMELLKKIVRARIRDADAFYIFGQWGLFLYCLVELGTSDPDQII